MNLLRLRAVVPREPAGAGAIKRLGVGASYVAAA
jgi:hypothetical protein